MAEQVVQKPVVVKSAKPVDTKTGAVVEDTPIWKKW